LENELSTAKNVKDRQNRQSVQRALKKCVERLKLEKETPPNGAILLCGTKSLHFFEPPFPVKRFRYLCDNKFHLDDIIPLFEYDEPTTQKYAVCVVSGTDAKLFFYFPEVDDFRPTGEASRNVRNKHGRGGYSQNRYQRLRDNEIKALVVKICDLCEEHCFSSDHVFDVKGLVIAGNGEKKNLVAKHLVEILGISTSSISVITTDGILEKSQDEARIEICQKFCNKDQRLAETEICSFIEMNPDRLVFGKKEVVRCLQNNSLKKVYILKKSLSEKIRIALDANNSAEKICFNVSPVLESYGDFIGLTWY